MDWQMGRALLPHKLAQTVRLGRERWAFMRHRTAAVLVTCLWGCAAEASHSAQHTVVQEPEALATGAEQIERLCARSGSDPVLDQFCLPTPLQVDGIVALRAALSAGSNEPNADEGYVLLGHSTALPLRAVSAINPRILFVRQEGGERELLVLAFARGEQFAEIVVRDRVSQELQFYLVTFSQDCNLRPDGCAPGDLLTPAAESGWREINVYAEDDLANTPRDCRVCHQPEGPGTPKLLRMQELEPPWNHWFFSLVEGGRALMSDYSAAKGDEPLAGVPGDALRMSNPGLLTVAIHQAGLTQPNEFVSSRIEREVVESAAALGGNQPSDNTIAGESPTWRTLYERAKRGEAISVPYHNVKIADQAKLARMTQAYVDYREGRLERDELPDIRDVHPDDSLRRAQIGLETEPGLDGNGVLLQACAMCHNDRLDQSLSRARFNVDLSKMDRHEKDLAIARVLLPSDDPAAMPPARFRALTQGARERLIELLQR